MRDYFPRLLKHLFGNIQKLRVSVATLQHKTPVTCARHSTTTGKYRRARTRAQTHQARTRRSRCRVGGNRRQHRSLLREQCSNIIHIARYVRHLGPVAAHVVKPHPVCITRQIQIDAGAEFAYLGHVNPTGITGRQHAGGWCSQCP